MVDLKKVSVSLTSKDASNFKLFKPFCSKFSKTRQLKQKRKMPRKTSIRISTHTHYCYVSKWLPSAYSEWLTLSSAFMLLNLIVSWKRRKLFVPIDWSSNSLQSATSWGLVRLSSVNSSSNSLENLKISSLLGLSPVSLICEKKPKRYKAFQSKCYVWVLFLIKTLSLFVCNTNNTLQQFGNKKWHIRKQWKKFFKKQTTYLGKRTDGVDSFHNTA